MVVGKRYIGLKSPEERIAEVRSKIAADMKAWRGGPIELAEYEVLIDGLELSREETDTWKAKLRKDWEQLGAGEESAESKPSVSEVVASIAKQAKARLPSDPWPEAPIAPRNATVLERLTYPRGLMGHVVQYIYDTDRLPDRLMALAGALLFCSKALDRKVIGPTDGGLVLFLLLIAESGAGKQHIMNCLRVLLRAIGAEWVIVGGGIASVQSIDEVLEGLGEKKPAKPSALVIIDEYGSFLQRISSKNQTGNVAEIPAKLQTLWGWSPEMEYNTDTKVGKDASKVIYGPAFSMAGFSTERVFFSALKQKNVSSGFVNRHFVLNAGRGALLPVKPKYKWLRCEEWLAEALRAVVGKPAPVDNRPQYIDGPGGRVLVRDTFRRLGWGPGAEELIYNFEVECRGLPLVEDREIWIRAHEIALRFASVLAVFRGSDVVEVEDVEWGIGLTRESTRYLMKGIQKHMLDEMEQADLVDYVRQEFRRKPEGELTHGVLRKLCERKCKDHKQIDAAIYHLELCNEIIELDTEGSVGRPTRKWKYVGK